MSHKNTKEITLTVKKILDDGCSLTVAASDGNTIVWENKFTPSTFAKYIDENIVQKIESEEVES